MYRRILDLKTSLKKKSHFLLGPRATGKSWLIRHQLAGAQIFDLLNLETFERLLRRPHSLAQEIKTKEVVIDEIQKLPRLLDEVHRLIEEKKIHFLLTGSSARKLKRGGANLLAGRARSLPMFPLTTYEIDDFDLKKYCNTGGLPLVYQSDEPWLDLKEYTQLYLKEEIISESIIRNIGHYARFLDVIGQTSGQELNYQKVSNESGVPTRTVANFVEVLKDTLLAFELAPFGKHTLRKAVSKTKIYMFDVGVANYLSGRERLSLKSEGFGKAFEHFIIQEIRAFLGYHQMDQTLSYWRTLRGDFEVDCIIGDEIALEIKSTENFNERMLKGLKAFKEEKKVKKFIIVTRDPTERLINGIQVMPYTLFLEKLWKNSL